MADITLSTLSRYKDTLAFATTGKPAFGLMEPPAEFIEETEGVRRHVIADNEIGFLDILAVRFFGQGYEELWWAIALANAIIDPEKDMVSGETLLIPTRESALRFISRVGLGETGG